MNCPSCNKGTIEIDNSVNEMRPYCNRCSKFFTQDYLDGYNDGIAVLKNGIEEFMELDCDPLEWDDIVIVRKSKLKKLDALQKR